MNTRALHAYLLLLPALVLLAAFTHCQQTAHQVAHHVVQEGAGVEVKAPVGAALLDANGARGLHRPEAQRGERETNPRRSRRSRRSTL